MSIDHFSQLAPLAQDFANTLLENQQAVATVESCTGGLLAGLLTSLNGSSNWFDRGFVTYSNQAKIEQVGVSATTLQGYGAVSEEVAIEMAEGGLLHSEATLAISVTGVAGPSGGSVDKPVGTVCIAWAQTNQETLVKRFLFAGDRASIRMQSMEQALIKSLALLG